MPSYEKPQKGNPYQLTVNQHAFPRRSIARFCNQAGKVLLAHFPTKKVFNVKPEDQLFCAKRSWDQRAESGYMLHIENRFQSLADAILDGRVKKIGLFEKEIINNFFALWNIRAMHKANPVQDEKLEGVISLAYNSNIDEQEYLESKHVLFTRPDLTFPGRQIAGFHIQRNIDMAAVQLRNAEWGILTAGEGEFIVPDNFSNARIVPLTPTKCLFSQSANDVITRKEVAAINQLALASAVDHVFARDLARCPLNIISSHTSSN